MTGEDFTAWMRHMGYNRVQAAVALGVGRNTVPRWMNEGAPHHVALACTALALGVKPWPLEIKPNQ